jgi:imidazole glycerol-phosphate synthase subunit HisH
MAAAVSIAILDTGSGNLRSVEKALARVGGRPTITSDPDRVRGADKLVVPGQGAFGEFMTAIRTRHLDEPIRAFIAAGRPYLGICLGMQVLFADSEEHGPVAGLGLLPGHVRRFAPADAALKVPHMGWNTVHRAAAGAHDPMLAGIADGAHVYFVHSYYVDAADPAQVALTCRYDVEFAAAVRADNLFACQFHPEKSQTVGLRILANFVEAT